MRPRSRRALLSSIATIGVASGCIGIGKDSPGTPADHRTQTATTTPIESATSTTRKADTPTDTTPETPTDVQCDRQWQPRVRWSLRTETRAFPPAVADGVVYFGSQDGYLYAVDADAGQVVWRVEHPGGSWSVPPVVADGVVTSVGSNEAAAYDAASGRELWSFVPPGKQARLTREFGDDGATLYVGAENHSSPSIGVEQPYDRLYAFDRRSGERRWDNTLTASHDEYLVPDAVTVGGSRVVAHMGQYGALVAFGAAEGRELWRRSYEESRGRPVVADGKVYQNMNRQLVALDATTGGTKWTASPGWTPEIVDGTVYIADNDVLRAHSASDGEVQWTASTSDGGYGGQPIRAGDIVYVSGGDGEYGRLSALDAVERCRLGGFTVRSAGPTVPAVAGDTVYVGGLNGEARMWAVSAP